MMTKKETQAFIKAMINLRESATDEQAKNVSILYPKWEENKEYEVGDRVVYNEDLYSIIVKHISLNPPSEETKNLYNLISK